jgi:SpoVK/Ycf46/Vps4 family AAA+-type ATPase
MATETLPAPLPDRSHTVELARQWRSLGRAATAVALLTSPGSFVWFHDHVGLSVTWSLVATFGVVVAFRGVVDLVFRRFIPWPSLFGLDDARATEEDVVARRRAWFWRQRLMLFAVYGVVQALAYWLAGFSPADLWHSIPAIAAAAPQLLIYVVFLFLINFLILFGPLAMIGISQIQAFEPGDADWGVKLQDVRGQAEAKEEVRRVVTLWQSGEAFERAGGKRERGLLLLGAPGTGKTMLSKAIATGFNCPFVSIPGSGFAQTFIGMDAVIVRYLARRAKRLARKWGGQCIVFIDEIDAVGMRRSSLGGARFSDSVRPPSFHDLCFYGPMGAITPSGDVIVETAAWRERLFAARASSPPSAYPPIVQRLGGAVNQVMPGMFGGGGQLALNQLLVVMDGIGNPPFLRKNLTRLVNTLLDAVYVIPRRIGSLSLRLPKPAPRKEQIYFIGACNVPIEVLDPALTRPGRMGRHVWFRTPTKDDRKDIFDLYLGKVDHEDDLDNDDRRDELARMTLGYSPAMIEQVCSMALTRAHYEGRPRFEREDIIEAMTTVESGTAINIEYAEHETRQVAIHEAGHAVASHVYLKGYESTRLSLRMRGGSLGHHSARATEERFVHWRHEEMAGLIHTLGAMAAEYVFYGENTTGVSGDVQSATTRAAWMVGQCAMAPEPIRLPGNASLSPRDRKRIEGRLQAVGGQIMRRSGAGGAMDHDPIAGVMGDREKRAMAAQMLGHAFVTAYNLVRVNKAAVEGIADVLVERREFYGDDVVQLLEQANLRRPVIDLADEASWPAQ